MATVTNVLLYCLVAPLLETLAAAPDTLKLANVVYRHGDRSPISIYPSDIYRYKEDTWPMGLGQLTQEGVQQEYDLGRYLRERYDGLLNTTYHKDQIYVRSTDVDRTLMSAQSVLMGLYPAANGQDWQGQWQPIPVHTVPVTQDNLLRMDPSTCPRRGQVFTDSFKQPLAIEFANKWQDVFQLIADKTNNTEVDLTDAWQAVHMSTSLRDTLFCERSHNLELEPWAQDVFDKLDQMRIVAFSYWTLMHGVYKSRFFGGTLVGKLVTDMRTKLGDMDTTDDDGTAPEPPPYNMYMYSGHDTSVAALLNALQVFSNQTMTYSVMVMVELHVLPDQGPVVRVFLRNDIQQPATQLQIPGCPLDCPLPLFVNLTAAVIPADLTKECQVYAGGFFQEFQLNSVAGVVLVSVLIGGMFLVILGLSVALCCRHKSRHRRPPSNYGKLRHEMEEEMPMMTSGDDL